MHCQEKKLIPLNSRQILTTEAQRKKEGASVQVEFPAGVVKLFLTRSTWQHVEQQKLLCYLKVQCIQSSETGSEMHFTPALKSSHRYEWILFQVICLLKKDAHNT